jgi:hypothetical protein
MLYIKTVLSVLTENRYVFHYKINLETTKNPDRFLSEGYVVLISYR